MNRRPVQQQYGPMSDERSHKLPYAALCALIGLIIGWFPMFFHGPIPEKWGLFASQYGWIDGKVMVWAYYVQRLLIGAAVGITVWPRQWFFRGPLVGVVMMIPLGIVAMSNPLCGGP